MSYEALSVTWFLLLGVLLAGYAVLDGFDLGVGILHPFVPKTDHERRLSMNSIGPLWDGNEVWLVTFGGALFAAFPHAYATVFSGFYTAFMLLLLALISRAVSLEFRSKVQSPGWRRFWDWAFFAGSALATLLFGVATGNAMLGIPLDAEGNFHGTVLDQLTPYPILVGLLTLTLFAMHGGLFLYLKTEGEFQKRLRDWMWRSWGLFLVLFMFTTVATILWIPRATANFEQHPWAAGFALVAMLAVANIPRSLYNGGTGQAFASSCVLILSLVGLFGAALFPNLVTASNEVAHSVTIWNGASSQKTLWIMLIIAMIGMPFVLTYSAVIYWAFRGKTKIGEHSY
ncbi:MAG: cytochrome d ubiquinol oxidase subunit II [Candidatus Eisenbacteria bacterium]|uniref:Cytochrome d ubiquinol oxidase subunit II n=1 Tax=Eiseniibacteriota bacterium TaxID=2212470 RepID=A0A956SCJ7_UNCEI|nr:cytochrome d ubiquinol oxidase subunit II [Candidatus Eisenbacteria bacterium]MCB9463527.1 cytochrome d ubiquinol oxidase subunit II [Candidatus Eisenbacteria bacterium]